MEVSNPELSAFSLLWGAKIRVSEGFEVFLQMYRF